MRRRLLGVCAGVLIAANGVWAQEAPTFRPRQLTVSGGISTTTSYPIGDITATWRRNSIGTPPPFTLLRAESEIGGALGLDGRLAFALTPAFAVEAGGGFSRPELGVMISADPEATGTIVASERVDQYVVDASGVYQLPLSVGRSARPYVLGGAGYLRQLHEGRLLVEPGATIHVGGGIQYWLHGGGRRTDRSAGVRAEARYVRRLGGIDFEDRSRGFPSVSALAFFGF